MGIVTFLYSGARQQELGAWRCSDVTESTTAPKKLNIPHLYEWFLICMQQRVASKMKQLVLWHFQLPNEFFFCLSHKYFRTGACVTSSQYFMLFQPEIQQLFQYCSWSQHIPYRLSSVCCQFLKPLPCLFAFCALIMAISSLQTWQWSFSPTNVWTEFVLMSVRIISQETQVSVPALSPHSTKLHIMCLLVSFPQKYHKSHAQ